MRKVRYEILKKEKSRRNRLKGKLKDSSKKQKDDWKEKRKKYLQEYSDEDRAQHQIRHLEKRAKERFHGDANVAELAYIVDIQIKAGNAILIGESYGDYLYDVFLAGKWYRVIYDPRTDMYKTLYPLSEAGQKERG